MNGICETMTIAELAEKIIDKMANASNIHDAKVDCDFAMVDYECILSSKTTEEIYLDAEGWYGIKKVNLGFDSEGVNLVCDYYGGGTADICNIFEDTLCGDDITGMIKRVISFDQSSVTDDETLIVEWL